MKLKIFLAFLITSLLALASSESVWANGTEIIVYGGNDPVTDVPSVQSAVDTYDTVILSGVFDFGDWEGVRITKPNTTVISDDMHPASILGGGRQIEHPDVSWFWYTIEVSAPDVTVQGLTFDGSYDTAILVYVTETGGGKIKLHDNSISNAWAPIAVVDNLEYPLEIAHNTVFDCDVGIFSNLGEKHAPVTVHKNSISVAQLGINWWGSQSELEITENDIIVNANHGIWIVGRSVNGLDDPEFVSNSRVKIGHNTIHLGPYVWAGISLGSSRHNQSNSRVEYNTIRGTASYGGLTKQPYGHNNVFIGNNLSDLTTFGPQLLLLGGQNNVFQNNQLGEVLDWANSPLADNPYYWAESFVNTASLAVSVNWHLNDGWNTPDPVNRGNRFVDNDYRLTGLPGWNDANPDSAGCILLTDFIERFYQPGWVPYFEDFQMKNVVKEHDFPSGTGLCEQINDLSMTLINPEGNNRIVDWKKECLDN